MKFQLYNFHFDNLLKKHLVNSHEIHLIVLSYIF